MTCKRRMSPSPFDAAFLPIFLLFAVALAGCQHSPLLIAGLDEVEITKVSDERLCNASATFVETRGRKFPVIEKEIARRGLTCGDNDVQIADAEQIALEATASTASPAEAQTRATRNVNMRAGPGTDHSIIGLLRAGDQVTVLAVGGNWCECLTSGGQRVFISCSYLSAPSGGWESLRPSVAETDNALSIAQAEKSGDPMRICGAAGTLNTPRTVKSGVRQIAAQAGFQPKDYPYGLVWRCSDGKMLVCGVTDMHSVTCSQRDRRQRVEFPEYCRDNPDAAFIPYAAGNRRSVYEWGCRGGVPAVIRRFIPESALDPVGFAKDEWRMLPNVSEKIRLTPIQSNVGGSHCSLYLDSDRRTLVGEVEYDVPWIWTIGLNGSSYKLQGDRGQPFARRISTVDGSISIAIDEGQTIRASSDPVLPWTFSNVTVRLTKNGSSSAIPAYQWCGEG